jgi:hypothetical protein
MTAKKIKAKYPGRCWCGYEWDAGDYIYWEQGESPICEGCGRDEEDRARRERMKEKTPHA